MGLWGDIKGAAGDGWNAFDQYSFGGLLPGGPGVDDPARSGGEYSGVDRNNFNLPGYDQQQDRLSGYLGQVDSRGAPQIGQYAHANNSSTFAPAQSQLAGLLMDRAQGNNSVAALQAQQGIDQANQAQRSFMASQRPGNVGMAMLAGGQNMANQSMGITGQAMLARAQEAQQAANSLGGVLAQGRGADEQTAMFNAGQQNQRTGQQAQMNQGQLAMNDAARAGYLGQSLNAAQMEQQGGMGYEQNRTQRFGSVLGVPTNGEVLMGGITGLAGGGLGGGKK